MKRTGPTNILARKLADELRKAARRNKAPVWEAVAEYLVKPTRRKVEVNLSKINRYAEEGEMVIVPGKVLGGGLLEKKVTIAAFSFSESALEKIKAAGSRALTLTQALRENPEGKKTRIIV